MMLRINDVALRANGHAFGVIWYETVEMLTDLWYNEAKKGGVIMKKPLNFIGTILNIGMIIWDVIEFLAIPALFLVIGLLNSFSWQYYAITIGGYFALFIILGIISHFVFKALDKKYTPFIERKLEKYFDKFSKKD